MARRRRHRTLRGPARRYRHDPARYEAVRHMPSQGALPAVTKLGCRDAVKGRKNPYKSEARGFVAAYREGYRICDAIVGGRERFLSRDERNVMHKLHLESEVQFTPLRGARRR